MSRLNAVVGHRSARSLLALVAVAAGVVLVVVALRAQVSAPTPPRALGRLDASGSRSTSTAPPSSTPASTGRAGARPSHGQTQPAGPTPLPASAPVRITIPAIGVRSSVMRIGLARNGTLAVPQPGPNENRAAWFENSPTPGQPGPAIIEGHVDTERGPSVFFELGDIRPGDRIHVRRQDGVDTTFRVDAVRDYQKDAFPTAVVYGAKDLSKPLLRLITCSDFDPSIGHHVGNEVVFAHLTSVQQPQHPQHARHAQQGADS